ncbi:hypothetical protein SCP_1000290 [Sparassis crispa]|uniref:Uncharacterized protein n=1 Tax=Sparassis crispa TaxID=139825 RepID=A0A401GX47_9APHY|nr:hypothetical protein SCP_1000290 [Sparassis crispa]GBE86787.1 hypothetical protein SCP_1000290 [Sparassis crispa]
MEDLHNTNARVSVFFLQQAWRSSLRRYNEARGGSVAAVDTGTRDSMNEANYVSLEAVGFRRIPAGSHPRSATIRDVHPARLAGVCDNILKQRSRMPTFNISSVSDNDVDKSLDRSDPLS